MDSCQFLAAEQVTGTLKDYVSVGFMNYINSAPILANKAIQVELSVLGYNSPKYSYPATREGLTAGEWNAAALKNNHLAFSFSSD